MNGFCYFLKIDLRIGGLKPRSLRIVCNQLGVVGRLMAPALVAKGCWFESRLSVNFNVLNISKQCFFQNRHLENLMVDTGILSKQYEVPLSRMLIDILQLDQ